MKNKTRNRTLPLLGFFLLMIYGLAAHPADNMKVKINLEKKTITVTAEHSVSNGEKHYIEKLTVTVNGEKVAEKTYTTQPDEKRFQETVQLESLELGDKVKLEAECNVWGDKTFEFDVKYRKKDKE